MSALSFTKVDAVGRRVPKLKKKSNIDRQISDSEKIGIVDGMRILLLYFGSIKSLIKIVIMHPVSLTTWILLLL